MQPDPVVEILKTTLAKRQNRNSSYSLRSFSRDLGMDPSNLLKILNYQKLLGEKLKTKLAAKVGLSTFEIDSLSIPYKSAWAIHDADYKVYNLELFEVISGWHHYAILELFKIKGFVPNPREISKRLAIPEVEAKLALKRLEGVGLLTLDARGSLVTVDDSSSSIQTVQTSQAHRNQQKEILEGAIEAIEKTPIEKRSQSSMTLAVDTENLDKARLLIKKFRRELGRLLSHSENLDEVYQLSVSLYPVTKKLKKENP